MGRLSLVCSVFLAIALVPAVSSAQGDPTADPDQDTTFDQNGELPDAPVVEEPPPPPPAPTPVVEENPDEGVPDAVVEDSSDSAGPRPDGWGFGIGLGYTFPADLDRINTTSFRFRFPGGFTIEPIFELSTDSDSTDFMGADSDDSEFDFRAAALGRIPVLSAGKLDLIILAGAGITLATDNDDGSDNDSSDFTIAGVWGIAIDYWITQNWALSLNATNPVFSVVLTKDEMGPGAELDTTSIELGAVFDPVIGAMLHLFF